MTEPHQRMNNDVLIDRSGRGRADLARHRTVPSGRFLGQLPDNALTRRQDRDLMRRGGHASCRQSGDRRDLLNVSRPHNRSLEGGDRKAHRFVSWKFRSGRHSGSLQQDDRNGGKEDQTFHIASPLM